MCERLAVAGMSSLLTRRRFLGLAAAAGAAVLARPIRATAGAPATVDFGGVPVVPRSGWGGDLAPTGPILPEPDVRFLLVHHSVDPGNTYAQDDVARILRGFVAFHTGDKGWPDLAYNFLVDRFGTVWEGRTGSLAGPVAGDATGGSQGFDQLCCFIGNHQTEEPTPEAFNAMGRLLGALATRYRVPLTAGATATFVSRGSNLHPAGTTVTTPTITGHRDMSRTQCPGDRVVARLPELRLLAAGGVAPAPALSSTTTTPTAPSTAASTTTTTTTPTSAPPTTAPTTTSRATTSTTAVSSAGGGGGLGPPAAVAGAALVAAGAAAVVAVVRKGRPAPDEQSGP